jgi:hypothetical protein
VGAAAFVSLGSRLSDSVKLLRISRLKSVLVSTVGPGSPIKTAGKLRNVIALMPIESHIELAYELTNARLAFDRRLRRCPQCSNSSIRNRFKSHLKTLFC